MLMIEKTVQYLIGASMVRTENLDLFFIEIIYDNYIK